MAGLVLPGCSGVPPPVGRHRTLLVVVQLMQWPEQVTESRHTERRTLLCFVRYGLAQFAFSVRGSSRRIMTMRFRPADIRVINRRFGLCSCHPLWLLLMLSS